MKLRLWLSTMLWQKVWVQINQSEMRRKPPDCTSNAAQTARCVSMTVYASRWLNALRNGGAASCVLLCAAETLQDKQKWVQKKLLSLSSILATLRFEDVAPRFTDNWSQYLPFNIPRLLLLEHCWMAGSSQEHGGSNSQRFGSWVVVWGWVEALRFVFQHKGKQKYDPENILNEGCFKAPFCRSNKCLQTCVGRFLKVALAALNK